MNHFSRFKQHLSNQAFLAIFLPGLSGNLVYIALREIFGLPLFSAMALGGAAFLAGVLLAHQGLLKTSIRPLEMIWQAIWHVSPGRSDVPPPNITDIKVGQELVGSMVRQVYDLASGVSNVSATVAATPASTLSTQTAPADNQPILNPIDASSLLEIMPLPILILDKQWTVKSANKAMLEYTGIPSEKFLGKHLHDAFHISFQSEDTLDSWLEKVVDTRVTDTRTWEHARLNMPDNTLKQFDMAASYNKDNSSGNEIVITLFDHTGSYGMEDKATSYVALAVHELRTPLTMLRGYIELFEDELGPTLSEEHREFMRKMSAAAQGLTAFISNILNVARIDENQFMVSMHESDWNQVLKDIISDLELRAQVRGKKLTFQMADNLPTVGVDKISMHEVVGNLVENAIKYSGTSTDIKVYTELGREGDVITTVEDQGVGMPESVIGELFTKFYRSHRSKNAVAGNGLGLYLVKSIVEAHGGRVWVQSKEGEGSRFSFSLQPFANIKESGHTGTAGIEHQAGGWIKNHSLYRR